jgi:hypothetical protein
MYRMSRAVGVPAKPKRGAASEMFPYPAPFLPPISAAMLRSPLSRASQGPHRGGVACSSRGERERSRLTLSRHPQLRNDGLSPRAAPTAAKSAFQVENLR